MRKWIILFGVITLLIGSLFIPVIRVFSFEGTRNHQGEAHYILFDSSVRNFEIIYTHSIHLSDVIEYYRVTNQFEIQSLAMEYEDFAIGMPSNAAEGETFEVMDGIYRLSYEKKVTKEFTMHISNITSMQHFVYDDAEYDLKEVLTKGSSYVFKLKKISIFQWWKGGFHK